MAAIAVRCEGLTKRYRVKTSGAKRGRQDFFALREVSFDVPSGEILGIVGRNGAGKSTLLKVLSRIVVPTAGRAELRGRLAGLLEVGTGFHPELTGRENIFLNGTIMGMRRSEVRAAFDGIIDFAGVEYFLDTPVKRYSSGMYVRLAFAVAAHLQAEILVLDEVLAVGDAAFQRKCLEKVQELRRSEGRTVLLVSHNADVIRSSATSAIRLEHGRLATAGTVAEVLAESEQRDRTHVADVSLTPRVDGAWGQLARLLHIEIAGGGRVSMGGSLTYDVTLDVRQPQRIGVGQMVTTIDGTPVATSFGRPIPLGVGTHVIRVSVDRVDLAPGEYALNVVIGEASFGRPDAHVDGVLGAVNLQVLPASERPDVDWRVEWWGRSVLAEPLLELVG